MQETSTSAKLLKVFQKNKQQLDFGSYGAELSFYIIWTIIPILLSLANIVAVLPFSSTEIITNFEAVLPAEIAEFIIPIFQGYLNNTSAGVFSLGLVISLWPVSRVFDALQRILNTIYDAEPRTGLLHRAFAYLFSLSIALGSAIAALVYLFGELVVNHLEQWTRIDFSLFTTVLDQSWILVLLLQVLIIFGIYQFIPNVKWRMKYSLPGTVFTLVGFWLVSRLFSLYLSLAGQNITSNNAIGVFIAFVIWLYFNCMVLVIGAYLNVLYHDYHETSYQRLVQEATHYETYQVSSDGFVDDSDELPIVTHKLFVSSDTNHSKKGGRHA